MMQSPGVARTNKFVTQPFNPVRGNGIPPFYAKGGRHSGLKNHAQELEAMGNRGDTILAHINPREAEELMFQHGVDINPDTGLLQFGLFDWLENNMPMIGSLVGNFFGGPLGGVIGGSIGGGLRAQAQDKNIMRGALKGAVHGGFTSAAAGLGNMALGTGGSGVKGLLGMTAGKSPLTSMMGSNVGGMLSNLTASGVPQGAQATGFSSIGSFLKDKLMGGSSVTAPGASGTNQASTEQPGFLSNIFGGSQAGNGGGLLGNILSNPIGLALLATAVGGTLGAKKERVKVPEEDIIPRVIDIDLSSPPARRAKPLKQRYIPVPKGHRPGIDPEHVFFDNVNPPTEYYEYGGPVRGNGDGQSDNIKLKNAYLSNGEYVLDSDVVQAMGDGSTEAGFKKLDKFRENVRSHKRSAPTKKIPPKAKPIESYMRGR